MNNKFPFGYKPQQPRPGPIFISSLPSLIQLGAVCVLVFYGCLAEADTLVHYTFGAAGTQTDPIYDSTSLTTQSDPTNVPTVNGNRISEGGDNAIGGAGDSTIALKTASTGSPANYPYLQAYAGQSAANSSVSSGTAITTAPQAETNNCYFTFAVSGVGTNTLNLTSLTFNAEAGGSGSRGFSIQESVDGFSTNSTTDFVGQTAIPTVRPTQTPYSYSLTASKFQGLTNIVFRIFVFGPGVSSSVEFDDFAVNGTVSGTMTNGAPATDVWAGNLSTNWDLTGALNWKNAAGGAARGFTNNDIATFDDTATGFAVNVATNIAPASIIVSNNAHNYVFTSVGTFTGNAIATNTPLTKSGPGTLKLGMSTTFGATAVSNGVVDLGGNNQTVGVLSGSGVISNATSGAGTPILSIGNGGGTSTYSGLFAGSMGISQVGSGLLVAGANTYTGPTTNTTGTLQVNGSAGLGNSSSVVITGGTLNLTNATINRPVTFTAGNLTEQGPNATNIISSAVTIADGTAYQLTVNSVASVSTGASLHFQGGVFAGTNNFQMVDDNSGNSDPGNIFIENTPMNLGSGWLQGYGWHINVASNIVGTINPYFGREATLGVNNAFANVPALVMGKSGTFGKLNQNGFNLTVNSVTSTGTTSADEITSPTTAALTVSNISPCTYVGILTGTGLSLVKDGPSALTLSPRVGANTYLGNTTIKAGTLILSNSVTISNSPSITVASGATLDVSRLSPAFVLAGGQTLSGSGVVTGAVTTVAGAVLAAGNGGIGTLNFSNSLTLNSGSTNKFIVTTAGGASNQVVVAGALTPNGSVVSVISGTALHPGTNTLFSYGSVSSSFSATPVFDIAPVHPASIVDNGVGQIELVVPNAVPVAGASFTLGATIGTPSTVQIVGGKYPPSDSDGDALTITVGGAANGTVTTDGTNITYTATNGTSDSFTYTVSDGYGGTASQPVNVNISSAVQGFNQVGAQLIGGNAVLTYLGIPGDNYALDWTHSLAQPITWISLVTNAAAANGYLNFTNTPSGGSDFYRTRQVP